MHTYERKDEPDDRDTHRGRGWPLPALVDGRQPGTLRLALSTSLGPPDQVSPQQLHENWARTCQPNMRRHPGLWPAIELAVTSPSRQRFRHADHWERLQALRFWQQVVGVIPDRTVTNFATDPLHRVNRCRQDEQSLEARHHRDTALCGPFKGSRHPARERPGRLG